MNQRKKYKINSSNHSNNYYNNNNNNNNKTKMRKNLKYRNY